jgi:hypothetical protein
MAHTGIFATYAECIYKAGYGASATAILEANVNQLCTEVESIINDLTKTNFSDIYAASINIDKKGILKSMTTSYVAWHIINYDYRGYGELSVAQSMQNVLWDTYQDCKKILEQGAVIDWIKINP